MALDPSSESTCGSLAWVVLLTTLLEPVDKLCPCRFAGCQVQLRANCDNGTTGHLDQDLLREARKLAERCEREDIARLRD